MDSDEQLVLVSMEEWGHFRRKTARREKKIESNLLICPD